MNRKWKMYLIEKKFVKGLRQEWKQYVKSLKAQVKAKGIATGKEAASHLDLCLAKISWHFLSRHTEVVPNQVMFRTYQDKYTCNPKYVCEELLRHHPDWRIIWVYSKKTGEDFSAFPKEVELVEVYTYRFYEAMAQSKYWIDNAHNFTWEGFPKKKEQILINLWHGSLGLKRIDAASDTNVKRQKAGKRAGKITNYCIANSAFEADVFRTSYWPHTPCLFYGHARNDIFFSKERMDLAKQNICETYSIPPDSNILLYAPTFRDDKTNHSCYQLDYDSIRHALETRFGGTWVILQRFHYHTKKVKYKKKAYLYDATSYCDMQELAAAADVALTDYSSWICDFVLTRRPGFLYTPDLEEYTKERGFYYPLTDTPFPLASHMDGVLNNILHFNEEQYLTKVEAYLKRLGCVEDGHAAEKIMQLLTQTRAHSSMQMCSQSAKIGGDEL